QGFAAIILLMGGAIAGSVSRGYRNLSMHQINLNLSDSLDRKSDEQAAKAEYGNVDDYLINHRKGDLKDENLDRFFTPERLAHIDRAAAGVSAGHGLTSKHVDAELARRRNEWLHRYG